MVGYYSILESIRAELDSMPFVNTITEGSIFDIDLNKQTIFPLCHIMVNSATIEEHVVRYNMSVIAMDIVDVSKDETTNIFRGNDNEQIGRAHV